MVNPCGKKTGVGVKLSRSLVASGFWPHRLYYYYHLYIFIYTFRIYIYIYRVFIYIHLSCDKSIYLKYTGVRVWVASYEKCSWSHVVFTPFLLGHMFVPRDSPAEIRSLYSLSLSLSPIAPIPRPSPFAITPLSEAPALPALLRFACVLKVCFRLLSS